MYVKLLHVDVTPTPEPIKVGISPHGTINVGMTSTGSSSSGNGFGFLEPPEEWPDFDDSDWVFWRAPVDVRLEPYPQDPTGGKEDFYTGMAYNAIAHPNGNVYFGTVYWGGFDNDAYVAAYSPIESGLENPTLHVYSITHPDSPKVATHYDRAGMVRPLILSGDGPILFPKVNTYADELLIIDPTAPVDDLEIGITPTVGHYDLSFLEQKIVDIGGNRVFVMSKIGRFPWYVKDIANLATPRIDVLDPAQFNIFSAGVVGLTYSPNTRTVHFVNWRQVLGVSDVSNYCTLNLVTGVLTEVPTNDVHGLTGVGNTTYFEQTFEERVWLDKDTFVIYYRLGTSTPGYVAVKWNVKTGIITEIPVAFIDDTGEPFVFDAGYSPSFVFWKHSKFEYRSFYKKDRKDPLPTYLCKAKISHEGIVIEFVAIGSGVDIYQPSDYTFEDRIKFIPPALSQSNESVQGVSLTRTSLGVWSGMGTTMSHGMLHYTPRSMVPSGYVQVLND